MPLSSRSSLILLIPPLMWAANAVVGHYAVPLIPPMLFNLLRWVAVAMILLPVAGWCLKPSSELWRHWKRYMVLGFLAVSLYNSFQYLALHTSSAINVTLIAASMPVWMIVVGALFFKTPATPKKLVGAAASVLGVLIVLSRGDLTALQRFHFVPGDIYILIAIMGWSTYSWLLTRTKAPEKIRNDWAAMLLSQVAFGLIFSSIFSVAEAVVDPQPVVWGWPLIIVLIFVAIGPAILAYRYWGEGVRLVGPTVAGFFANLTPLFTALMSAAFFAEYPQGYHLLAFALIVAGIWLSSTQAKPKMDPAPGQ